jgi:hypothetical protein
VASVGFGDFFGRRQLARLNAERLRERPHGARRRRGAGGLEAGDGERVHTRAAGELRLRKEFPQADTAEVVGESHGTHVSHVMV